MKRAAAAKASQDLLDKEAAKLHILQEKNKRYTEKRWRHYDLWPAMLVTIVGGLYITSGQNFLLPQWVREYAVFLWNTLPFYFAIFGLLHWKYEKFDK